MKTYMTPEEHARLHRRRARQTLGLLIAVLALVGIVTVVRAGVKGVATLFDDTQQKAEYEDRLEGLVLFDPLPFDGIENINDLTLREAAVWGCVYSIQETQGGFDNYNTDPDTEQLLLPSVDVDAYLAKPFVMQELESLIYTPLTTRMKLRGKLLGLTESDEVKLPEIKSNDSALMERVMRSIQENIANPDFSVESLAEAVGLSRVQLHRKLKELTGLPASDLIRNVRMKHAATLLKENKVNIAQVAYAVGYTNQTYFSTCFRKYWGVSPTDYIEKVSQ